MQFGKLREAGAPRLRGQTVQHLVQEVWTHELSQDERLHRRDLQTTIITVTVTVTAYVVGAYVAEGRGGFVEVLVGGLVLQGEVGLLALLLLQAEVFAAVCLRLSQLHRVLVLGLFGGERWEDHFA